MKKHRKLLVICLVFAFVAAFSVSSVHAAWMNPAVIDSVHSSANGDYTVRATYGGTWTKTFTILSTDVNANTLLAIALTALSAGMNVAIEFTGSNINHLYVLK